MKLSRSTTSPDTEGLPPDVTFETRQVLAGMRKAGKPPMYSLSAQEARAFYEQAAPILELSHPAGVFTQDTWFVARDGFRVTVRIYDPVAPQMPRGINDSSQGQVLRGALLYFHGGGFTVGSVNTHDGLCRRLCQGSQQRVISVNYRLAPEHPFPQAVYDAFDALTFLIETGQTWGVDPQSLMVGGDSAGGTLASVVALHARDMGWKLKGQLLIYPGTTADQQSDSHRRYATGYVLEDAHIRYFFDHYIPDLPARRDWRFAPLLASDHGSLAPVWMVLAGCDPLRDEGLLYAEVLKQSGVAVDVRVYEGVVHGFVQWSRVIPQAQEATLFLAHAMKTHL